ncbi:SDR family NAD(P)-dependent oxidoreductase [Brevibacterium antiquum]|uniref:SDR family NAD(P)-dependent oxidoreductase n=1 Tax=Brevibacterium antiquum TaxID=234835 RepID=UPI0018E0303B|nr:SDR family oxidoreductase [Brevibacterium antiquum]
MAKEQHMELEGRTIIVTGAAGGIGSAIATACAYQGGTVIAVDRVETTPDPSLPAEVDARISSYPADISTAAGCVDLLTGVLARFGVVDGLVNCAGVMRRGSLLAIDEDDWATSFAVNVDAVMRLSRGILPSLIGAGTGSIVNIASQWGLHPAGGHIAYNTSKAAVVSFSQSLARDYGRQGVRVNAVCPGEILTPMLEQKLESSNIAEAVLAEAIPLGRLGRPDEVAELTTFLLSDRASFISGAAIEITGAQQVG